MHKLFTTESGGTGSSTEAVSNADGVNASDVEENELGWSRGQFAMFANAVAKLIYDAKIEKGFGSKELPGPSLQSRL